ncbi:hypothetical protein ACWCP6_19330 [Streptomyces sp. NPDC002004]
MSVPMIRQQVADERGGDAVDAVGTAFTAGKTQLPRGTRSMESSPSGIEAARCPQATVAKWAVGHAPTSPAFEVRGAHHVLG